MIKVMCVFGTRPEAIKLAPLILELNKNQDYFVNKICITAQHREMLDPVLKLFEISSDYDLDVMKKNQSLFDISTSVMKKLHKVFRKEKPDLIAVQGDTTTAFIAGLAAYYLKIKVAHVEAGLRTGNKFNPYPEEMNRKFIDYLADYCFAHTKRAAQNLLDEGIEHGKIFITGNTVVDALLLILEKQKKKKVQNTIKRKFEQENRIAVGSKKIVLVTGHRRESFGMDLKNICLSLRRIAENRNDIQIIYPVHLNPNVQKTVKKLLYGCDNINLIKPLDYFTFIWLMSQSHIILTDSGGIQEEAPSLGKPVLVMRKITERPEGVAEGIAKVVGTDSENIYNETIKILEDQQEYKKMVRVKNPFGDGKASCRIVNILKHNLKLQE